MTAVVETTLEDDEGAVFDSAEEDADDDSVLSSIVDVNLFLLSFWIWNENLNLMNKISRTRRSLLDAVFGKNFFYFNNNVVVTISRYNRICLIP